MTRLCQFPSRRRAGLRRGEGAHVGGALSPSSLKHSRTPAQAPDRAERRPSSRAGRSTARGAILLLPAPRALRHPGPIKAAPRDRAVARGLAVPCCLSPTWGASLAARPVFSLEAATWTF